MTPEGLIAIEVVFALPDQQVLVALDVERGMTAGDAIRLSRLPERYRDIDMTTVQIGIYGRVVERETILRDGDRVEIYRPLAADPKQARRRRATPPR